MNSYIYTLLLILGIDVIFFVAEKIIKANRHIAVSALTTIVLYILGIQLSGGIIYLSINTTKNFHALDYILLIFNILYAWWRITDRISNLNKKYGNL